MNLFIFSEDLRIRDNKALYEASLEQEGLIALYIINKGKNEEHGDSLAKLKLKLLALAEIRNPLVSLNIPIKILHSRDIKDEPKEILEFCKKHQITNIFLNSEYPFNEQQRNKNLEILCNKNEINLKMFDSQLIDPTKVKNNSGQPFKVFTPYSKKIRALLTPEILQEEPEPLKQNRKITDEDEIPSFNDTYDKELNFSIDNYPVTEKSAAKRLEEFVETSISDYKELRDIPSLSSTSNLSSSFAIGLVTSKQAINQVFSSSDGTGTGQFAWVNEIIWREFYKYITYHYPHVSKGKSFNPKYDLISWREDEDSFIKWCEGKTGIPIVDAAMRQLNQTKWMHNRLRMITAMFLSKNLLIDWRKGERYFMENLIDGDFCSNNGGWQWSASTGVDASPYFRIFNPITQSEKFDPDGKFIKKFVPELFDCPSNEIHNPSKETRSSLNYPEMIVDLKSSRIRAIDAFKSIK
ncbi:DNA photolyase family protein [SAR86 cluster bacterium]|nr:DNA photolyase family protein [SAR86 cluster bacterium]